MILLLQVLDHAIPHALVNVILKRHFNLKGWNQADWSASNGSTTTDARAREAQSGDWNCKLARNSSNQKSNMQTADTFLRHAALRCRCATQILRQPRSILPASPTPFQSGSRSAANGPWPALMVQHNMFNIQGGQDSYVPDLIKPTGADFKYQATSV